MTPAEFLGISERTLQFMTDTTQALTVILVLASVVILGKTVHVLLHAVHLLSAAKMTESLARESSREWE